MWGTKDLKRNDQDHRLGRTNQLQIFLEKLVVIQLVKKFSAFYGAPKDHYCVHKSLLIKWVHIPVVLQIHIQEVVVQILVRTLGFLTEVCHGLSQSLKASVGIAP